MLPHQAIKGCCLFFFSLARLPCEHFKMMYCVRARKHKEKKKWEKNNNNFTCCGVARKKSFGWIRTVMLFYNKWAKSVCFFFSSGRSAKKKGGTVLEGGGLPTALRGEAANRRLYLICDAASRDPARASLAERRSSIQLTWQCQLRVPRCEKMNRSAIQNKPAPL